MKNTRNHMLTKTMNTSPTRPIKTAGASTFKSLDETEFAANIKDMSKKFQALLKTNGNKL